jgi:hypothetical protein
VLEAAESAQGWPAVETLLQRLRDTARCAPNTVDDYQNIVDVGATRVFTTAREAQLYVDALRLGYVLRE